MVMTLMAIVVMAVYMTMACRSLGRVPGSLSQTVEAFPGREWVFTLAVWWVVALLVPVLMEKSSDGTRWLCWALSASVLIVGAAPLLDGADNSVHYGAGIVAGVSSQALVATNRPVLMVLWAGWVLWALTRLKSARHGRWKHWVLAIEAVCVSNILCLCLIK